MVFLIMIPLISAIIAEDRLLPTLRYHENPNEFLDPWNQFHQLGESTELFRKHNHLLPAFLSSTHDYDFFNYTKFSTYGCHCLKFSIGRGEIRGKPVDDFDKLCKEWLQLRHCLKLSGGTCQNDELIHTYHVYLNHDSVENGPFLDIDDHCAPIEFLQGSANYACMKPLCRIDYIYMNKIFEKYVEMDIGNNHRICTTGWVPDDEDKESGKVCSVTEEYPYVKISSSNNGLAHRYRRSRGFRQRRHRKSKRGKEWDFLFQK